MTAKAKSPDYAGFWVRVASFCIDVFLITCLPVVLIALVTPIVHPRMSTGSFLTFVLLLLIGASLLTPILYFAWFNANKRQSPGKKVFGLVVVNDSEQSISFFRSLGRTAAFVFDCMIFGLGHVLLLFNQKKKTLHDVG